MPQKKYIKKGGVLTKGLNSNQVKSVKAITRKVLRSTMETKTVGGIQENQQLLHNKTAYYTGLLSTKQGVTDPNDQSGASARIGDEISLRNVNVRFWLSNKNDRPNVMYKCYLFWYTSGASLSDAYCYFTNVNKMLDRANTENIGIIDQKTIFSQSSYSTGVSSVGGSAKEHSQLCTLNGNWKGKKIVYTNGGSTPTKKDIGFMVVAYDAYGSLQTDNIASFAYNYVTRFQDP